MRALKQAVRARMPEPIADALRHLRFEMKAAAIGRRSSRRFEAVAGKKELKVHLGAGDDIRLGWVNIDLRLRLPPDIDEAAAPGTVFINHDLRRGLPLADGSCALIYSSHFFEHLTFPEAADLLRECLRVLRPGGIVRLALPDFLGMFDAYVRKDRSYFDLVDLSVSMGGYDDEATALVDHVNYAVYQDGEHKSIWDPEKAIGIFKKLGYSSVAETAFNPDLDPASPLRRRYSFYVEAVK